MVAEQRSNNGTWMQSFVDMAPETLRLIARCQSHASLGGSSETLPRHVAAWHHASLGQHESDFGKKKLDLRGTRNLTLKEDLAVDFEVFFWVLGRSKK